MQISALIQQTQVKGVISGLSPNTRLALAAMAAVMIGHAQVSEAQVLQPSDCWAVAAAASAVVGSTASNSGKTWDERYQRGMIGSSLGGLAGQVACNAYAAPTQAVPYPTNYIGPSDIPDPPGVPSARYDPGAQTIYVEQPQPRPVLIPLTNEEARSNDRMIYAMMRARRQYENAVAESRMVQQREDEFIKTRDHYTSTVMQQGTAGKDVGHYMTMAFAVQQIPTGGVTYAQLQQVELTLSHVADYQSASDWEDQHESSGLAPR
jgi:hypothetical protein